MGKVIANGKKRGTLAWEELKKIREVVKPLERAVILIDGGYLRRLFIDLFGDDNINYTELKNNLLNWYNTLPTNPFRANLIRVYYHDGIVDEKEEEYAKQREYFDTLTKNYFFMTLTLGEVIKKRDGTFRQKGVDIIIAIEALVMAHLDQYDSGLFLLGDRDFIPLIQAVKDAGKKTFGFFHNQNVSKELIWTFAFRLAFDRTIMEKWRLESE